MADRLYRAQVTIPLDSGIPEDSIVNTFYFDDDDDPVAGPEDTQGWIIDKLRTFYHAIDGVLFPSTVGPAATVKLYDMRDPEPRVVRHQDTIDLTPLGGNPLPNEVSLCLSFAASIASGERKQRRRGRVYLGPVSVDATKIENSQMRPSDAARFNVAVAASTMNDGFLHPGSPGLHLQWAIYSPTTHKGGGNPPTAPASIDSAFNDVVSGWVDDAFDTQRRRGAAPTARTNFS